MSFVITVAGELIEMPGKTRREVRPTEHLLGPQLTGFLMHHPNHEMGCRPPSVAGFAPWPGVTFSAPRRGA